MSEADQSMKTFIKRIYALFASLVVMLVVAACAQTTIGSTTTSTENLSTSDMTTSTSVQTTTTLMTSTVDGPTYQVINGGFETGDLSGWMVLSGNAFVDGGVSDSDYIEGSVNANKDGDHFYGIHDEAAVGMMVSDSFVLGGSGYISFRLGAGYNEGLNYVSIIEVGSGVELYRFGNSAFDRENYDSYQNGNDEARLNPYIANLAESIGKEVQILIVDNSTRYYGYLTLDDFVTYYDAVDAVPDFPEAIDIKPVFPECSDTGYTVANMDFSEGTLAGWSVVGEKTSFLDSHINDDHFLSNRPNETSVGILRSSAFKVGGENLLSFRLGATKYSDVTYMSIKLVGTNTEIFRTYSDRWKDTDEEKTHLYFVDLSAYAGQCVYLEFIDNSRGDWGLLTIEDIITYYDYLPDVNDEIAVNLLEAGISDPDYEEMRSYVDNLIAEIVDIDEKLTLEKTFYATIDGITNIKGSWPSVLEYNQNHTTFIYTGDIHAMWLRDSSAQVLPYLQFMNMDEDVKLMVKGLLKLQFEFIRRDPYANAFNPDGSVFERKFEIDSLCYPIWLAYEYYTITGDTTIFDKFFMMSVNTIIATLDAERSHSDDNYRIENAYDRSIGSHDVNRESGLVWTGYRPSDDVAYYKYNIPENMFAVATLEKIATIYENLDLDPETMALAGTMAMEIRAAIETYGTYEHEVYGKIYVYETTGFNSDPESAGDKLLMDAANIPSLLAAPWLGYCEKNDPTYLNTRAFILSTDNPYYYEGTYAAGIGDPHDMVGSSTNPHPDVPVPWHMAIAMQAITSSDQTEIDILIGYMTDTTAGTYVMHEAFNADNPGEYSRDFFTWPCSLYAYAYITKILHVDVNG